MKKIYENLKGFTLVELMVVVAIIGILSAIAVPNFKKYQSRSKTTEARVQLAALYSAEVSAYTDYSTYVTCLDAIGFNPSAEAAQRYYAIGFTTEQTGDATYGNTMAFNAGLGSCNSAPGNTFQYAAGKANAGQSAAAVGEIPTTAVVTDANTFTAGAGGKISDSGTNQWTINHNKQIIQTSQGY